MLGSNGETSVYHASPPEWLFPVVDNEPQPHAMTCLHSKLAIVCNYQLVSTPNLSIRGHSNISK